MFDKPREWLAKVEASRRCLPYGERPTDLHVRIAAKLAFWRGSCWPSHAQLARAAGCSPETVENALKRLRGLGLLQWASRSIRGVGWVRRLSNAYAPAHCKPLKPIRIYYSATLTPPHPTEAPSPAGWGQSGMSAEQERRTLRALNAARERKGLPLWDRLTDR